MVTAGRVGRRCAPAFRPECGAGRRREGTGSFDTSRAREAPRPSRSLAPAGSAQPARSSVRGPWAHRGAQAALAQAPELGTGLAPTGDAQAWGSGQAAGERLGAAEPTVGQPASSRGSRLLCVSAAELLPPASAGSVSLLPTSPRESYCSREAPVWTRSVQCRSVGVGRRGHGAAALCCSVSSVPVTAMSPDDRPVGTGNC